MQTAFKSSGVLLAGRSVAGRCAVAAEADGAATSTVVPRLGAIEVQGSAADTVPEGTARWSRTQMDDRSIDSWEDLSRRGNAGVNFSRGNDNINVRGMDRDRVVTRVDGIRIPWLTDGSRGEEGGLSAIDFHKIGRATSELQSRENLVCRLLLE